MHVLSLFFSFCNYSDVYFQCANQIILLQPFFTGSSADVQLIFYFFSVPFVFIDLVIYARQNMHTDFLESVMKLTMFRLIRFKRERFSYCMRHNIMCRNMYDKLFAQKKLTRKTPIGKLCNRYASNSQWHSVNWVHRCITIQYMYSFSFSNKPTMPNIISHATILIAIIFIVQLFPQCF